MSTNCNFVLQANHNLKPLSGDFSTLIKVFFGSTKVLHVSACPQVRVPSPQRTGLTVAAPRRHYVTTSQLWSWGTTSRSSRRRWVFAELPMSLQKSVIHAFCVFLGLVPLSCSSDANVLWYSYNGVLIVVFFPVIWYFEKNQLVTFFICILLHILQ